MKSQFDFLKFHKYNVLFFNKSCHHKNTTFLKIIKFEILKPQARSSNIVVKQIPDLPESFPGPIIGCKCSTCKSFFRTASISINPELSDLGIFQMPKMANSVKKFKNDLSRLTFLRNSKLFLEVGQRILVKRNRIGTIRYMGHMEKTSRKTMVITFL